VRLFLQLSITLPRDLVALCRAAIIIVCVRPIVVHIWLDPKGRPDWAVGAHHEKFAGKFVEVFCCWHARGEVDLGIAKNGYRYSHVIT
jgi:hypothetical protein